MLHNYNCNYNFEISCNDLFTFKSLLLRSCLPLQDEVNPTRCYPGFQQAQRQRCFGTCCTTGAKPRCTQEGQGRTPCRTASRGAQAVPACPTGRHMLPIARVAARDTGKGVGSEEISCYSSFLYLGFHQALEHIWYQTFLFPHYHPISYPTAPTQPCKLTFCNKYASILQCS